MTFIQAQPTNAGGPISVEPTIEKQENLQVGSCTYEVLVIRNRLLNAEGKVTSEHVDFYSSDLGFVLAKKYDEGGGRESLVKCTQIAAF